MKDLPTRMFYYTSLDEGERGLENHISLLSSKERLQFIRDVSDKRHAFYFSSLNIEYGDVFANMNSNIGWRDTFERRVHFQELKTTYDNKKSTSNYYDGILRPGDGLDEGMLPVFDLIIVSRSYHAHKKVNRSLMKCGRNMESHIDENCVGPFSDLDKDVMIMYTFERQLVEFHEGLCLKRFEEVLLGTLREIEEKMVETGRE